ncbi:MAG: DUF58 domain-containing protein [Methylococcaceae bacterium]|jgi:uncharacterized protein (DUF58 family)
MSHKLKFAILGLFTLAAYAGSLNRGPSLLWLIAALLSASLITSLLWPRWLLQRLSVNRSGPKKAIEDETVVFMIDVKNHGWLPRFMVSVLDHLPFVDESSNRGNNSYQLLGNINSIASGKNCRFEVPVLCEKRGLYTLGPVGLASSFPLGLAQAQRITKQSLHSFTIYPKVFPILNLPLFGAPSQIHRGGYLLPEGAGAAEFSGLRAYRRGDNPHHIHWPTTARLNDLMVKEFEPLASACLCIALDLAFDANAGKGKQSTLEYAIRIAASIAGYACQQNMHSRLMAEGKSAAIQISSGKGDYHYQCILDTLATVEANGKTPYSQLLLQIALDCCRGETVVLLLSEPPIRNAATLQAMALLRTKGAHLFAVFFDRSSFFLGGQTTENIAQEPLYAGLLELSAHTLIIHKGDDLMKLFNL